MAAAANGRGVVGVAPRAKVMAVKVLSADGGGTTGAEAEGIRYAAANGARVINVSLQGDDPDPRLDAAVADAAAANALVVVSAGNSARNVDAQPSFPAAIPAPNLIGVAATAPEEGRTLDLTPTTAASPSSSPRLGRRSSRPPTAAASSTSRARRWRRRWSPASPR